MLAVQVTLTATWLMWDSSVLPPLGTVESRGVEGGEGEEHWGEEEAEAPRRVR